MNRSALRLAMILTVGASCGGAYVVAHTQQLRPSTSSPYYASSAASGAPAATGASIKVDNFSFTPATLTIAPGTQVTWTNHDDVPHTIVSSEHKFKSKALDTDESFSFDFTEAGTYEYFCSLHPKMTAKIVVEAHK